MMHLRSDRAAGLLLNGGGQLFLGLSYATDVTPIRQHQFGWLSAVGLQISWAGWIIALCGLVALAAGLVSPPREWLHKAGWQAAIIPPLILAALWAWTSFSLALQGHYYSSLSPLTTVVIYLVWMGQVAWMAGKPDEVRPSRRTT